MIVFDASAAIAYIRREPGWQKVADHLSAPVISTINLQEVASFLILRGVPLIVVRTMIDEINFDIRLHGKEDALASATLVLDTKKFGSGLGDRSCMALAIKLGVPALTADRAWAKLEIPGLEVILAR